MFEVLQEKEIMEDIQKIRERNLRELKRIIEQRNKTIDSDGQNKEINKIQYMEGDDLISTCESYSYPSIKIPGVMTEVTEITKCVKKLNYRHLLENLLGRRVYDEEFWVFELHRKRSYMKITYLSWYDWKKGKMYGMKSFY